MPASSPPSSSPTFSSMLINSTPNKRRQLHVLVPGICGPLAEIQSLKSSQLVERWIKTLSKSHCTSAANSTNEVIASLFGLQFENDFPSAVYALLANDMYDATRFYMHADPVHLRADLEQAVLSSSVDLSITEPESKALYDMLNAHFKQDGLHFLALNKDQWFISSDKEIQINTTSLIDAVGRNVNFILPKGENSGHWKKILTEAQMLMHMHKVNDNRENNGYMTINSLWFHGAGIPGKFTNKQVNCVCSNHDVVKGLADASQCHYMKMPSTVAEYINYLQNSEAATSSLLHITDLENLVNYTDTRPWLNQLAETLNNWIYPLISFSNKNNFQLTLYTGNEKKYQFSKSDVLKFWRKDKLETHVNSY